MNSTVPYRVNAYVAPARDRARPRRLGRLVTVLCLLVSMTGMTVVTGCNAQWWQSITSSPGSAIQFVQYVASFIPGLTAVWATILPLLPAASQAQANTAFNNAIYSAEQALSALEDAIRAAAAAQQATPDFTQLIANVQAAIASLMNIFNQWSTSPAVTSSTTAAAPAMPNVKDITRQASVIATWK